MDHKLEQMVHIHFCSFQFTPTGADQAGKGSGRWHSGSPQLAYSGLVSSVATFDESASTPAASRKDCSVSISHETSTSTTQETSTSGSSMLREALETQGFSADTCDIMYASWRDSTKRQYSTYLARWKQFCVQRKQDPFQASVKLVLEFLTQLYQLGLGYSAMNTARSAVSAVTVTDDDRSIGAHSKIVRFMKGVFEQRTPQPRYKQTWDVNVLLTFFRQQQNNKDLSLKDLTVKLCALLLIASAQRVQTIHLIKLGSIHFHEKGCTILMVEKLKHTKPGKCQNALEFSYYEDKKICVVTCLKDYIEKTSRLRSGKGSSDKLLLCYCSPHGPASKDTVARWLKGVLKSAGLEQFAPHSFRGAASSAMLQGGMTLEDIMKSAGWSNATTFHRFYNRAVLKENQEKLDNTEKNSILNYFRKS